MSFSTLWKKLKKFLHNFIVKHKHPKHYDISVLIPFSTKDPIRKKHHEWLLRYWRRQLPDAELIIGKSKSKVFCKGEALNNAVKKAKGSVFVILDADAYMSGKVIEHCVKRIKEELENGEHLWYVPYRRLYRLNPQATEKVVHKRYHPSDPPLPSDIDVAGHKSRYGHHFGAMCMIFPREAYEAIRCFDERFEGWGGEDMSLLKALDILWGKHKTTNNAIFHLWHPFLGGNYKERKWAGQSEGNVNSTLAGRYSRATNDPEKMKILINEAYKYKKDKEGRQGLEP